VCVCVSRYVPLGPTTSPACYLSCSMPKADKMPSKLYYILSCNEGHIYCQISSWNFKHICLHFFTYLEGLNQKVQAKMVQTGTSIKKIIR